MGARRVSEGVIHNPTRERGIEQKKAKAAKKDNTEFDRRKRR